MWKVGGPRREGCMEGELVILLGSEFHVEIVLGTYERRSWYVQMAGQCVGIVTIGVRYKNRRGGGEMRLRTILYAVHSL